MYTIACARVALECDASTDVEVGDVVTVRRVESTDDGETLAFARARSSDGDASTSDVRSFEARAKGPHARAFAAFGDRGKMRCVGERRGERRRRATRGRRRFSCVGAR